MFWLVDVISDANVQWVLVGAVLLGISAGMTGCFAFLQKRSLTGDALAHAALPGICTAFMIVQVRDPLALAIGATVSAYAGLLLIEWLTRGSRISKDTALAVVLSSFFAVGVFQLSLIQKTGNAAQSGLDKILFGQAASLVRSDVNVLVALSVLVVGALLVFFRRFTIVTFDRNAARAQGLSVRFYEGMFSFLLVLSIVIGVQLVGIVLMAALLVVPASSARYWTERLSVMLALAAAFGALAGIGGVLVSAAAPRMPTGPWMVMVLSTIFTVSVLFAPERGVVQRAILRRVQRRKIADENILRTAFKAGEAVGQARVSFDLGTVLRYRSLPEDEASDALRRLLRLGDVVSVGSNYQLSPKGYERAQRITRLHRLWETYLSTQAQIPADHVHDDAEEIEHILTPELERQILAEIAGSETDPHGKVIPSRLAVHTGKDEGAA